MARVTVGVPVYNGGEMLRESLECLRTQTFEDFEVLIGDNASEDQTGAICAEFAARDGRFHHVRRAGNIGSLPNFADLRKRADTELFMWRAHDDLSAPNFIETLVACLDGAPAADLAVSRTRTEIDNASKVRAHRFRSGPGMPKIAGVAHRLFCSHATWIYGLWRRERLGLEQDRTLASYPHDWGWDHLCFLPLLLDGAVIGSNDTTFVQRIVRSGTTRADRQAGLPDTDFMTALRRDFAQSCAAEVWQRDWSPAERLVLRAILPFYIDRRGYSRFKLMRRRWREGRRRNGL